MNKPSLRDIKREETAHALAEAAFELALERGLDGFVIDDIVQRAHYSRRTFANHFTCKEEAVAMAALGFHRSEVQDDFLIPDSMLPLDALHQWMSMQLTTEILWRLRELVSLSNRHPTLEPYILSILHRLQSAAHEELHSLYHGRYSEEYTHLLVGAVFGAVLPIINGSLRVQLPGDTSSGNSGATAFDPYLDTVFGYLRNGF